MTKMSVVILKLAAKLGLRRMFFIIIIIIVIISKRDSSLSDETPLRFE